MFAGEILEKDKSLKELPLGQRGKKIGQLWAQLPQEQKDTYKEQYRRQMDEYKKVIGNKGTPSKQKLQMTEGNKLYIW